MYGKRIKPHLQAVNFNGESLKETRNVCCTLISVDFLNTENLTENQVYEIRHLLLLFFFTGTSYVQSI